MADLTPTPASALAMGDPARRPVGRAVLGSLALAALFVLVILPAPALPTMWSNGPWAHDPYHVVVSFAVFFVPLVSVLCMSRVPLCRRGAPPPARPGPGLPRGRPGMPVPVLLPAGSTPRPGPAACQPGTADPRSRHGRQRMGKRRAASTALLLDGRDSGGVR